MSDGKVIVVGSTNGSVLSEVLRTKYGKFIDEVISDRECGAVQAAVNAGVSTRILRSKTGRHFSKLLADYLNGCNVGLILSFYTKLFHEPILTEYYSRLLNFHPSLLPAFPGIDGFGDAVRYGARFIGSTLHLVDSGIDTGKPVVQSVRPFNPYISLELNRHIIFLQQCKILMQILAWYKARRLIDGEVVGGSYCLDEFSPNLEEYEIINFDSSSEL